MYLADRPTPARGPSKSAGRFGPRARCLPSAYREIESLQRGAFGILEPRESRTRSEVSKFRITIICFRRRLGIEWAAPWPCGATMKRFIAAFRDNAITCTPPIRSTHSIESPPNGNSIGRLN